MRQFLFRHGGLALSIALLLWTLPVTAQQGASTGDWHVYGGDGGGTRYSALDQITRDNVKTLKVAWTWKSDNFSTPPEIRSETTPLMVNGLLYFTAGSHRAVVAADAGTGETQWLWKNDETERYDKAPRKGSGRGVAYWTDGRDERIFTVTPGFRLVALNAKNGYPISGFGQDGVVDLFKELGVAGDPIGTIGNTSPPVVTHDLVIIGPALAESSHPKSQRNTKADIMAFDVRTGKKVWAFHTVPRRGELGYDTWLNNSAEYTGNAGVWTPFVVDEELGYVYLPVESATSEYYGGHRPGNNLFSSSLVCLDVKTGKRIWHYQIVHHDIWDYDMVAPPMLVDITVNGRPVKAVVAVSKMAYAYVFDRVTGQPVWSIEERPVPQTDVPGEWTSPTQPMPTKPPAFDRQGLAEDVLIDFTPELRQAAIQLMKQYRTGPLFTPPSLAENADGTKGTMSLPGSRGGANWNLGAADPETGYVYIASVTRPTILALVKPNTAESDMAYYALSLAPPLPTVEGLPFFKAPYGRITAYNMNTGEIAWQIANGDTPPDVKNNPKLAGLQIPRTGSISHAGILATRTLLFAGEGDGGLPMFRAHDKKTGQILWETQIPAGAQTGLPVTYMHKGKQYIVFAAAGANRTAGQLVAYALP